MANETTMTTSYPDWNHSLTEKKYVYKEDNDEYASKGVAGTALGIGIGALALTLLGRNGGLSNLLGCDNTNGCATTCKERMSDMKEYHDEMFKLYKSQVDADFSLYKGYRDANDAIIAKNNADLFALYQSNVTSTKNLQEQIDELKTKMAVDSAVEPWRTKAIYDAIALEKERRECADCSIVGYANCTFIPQYIADMTPATTSTKKAVYNPLSCINNNNCGCNCIG